MAWPNPPLLDDFDRADEFPLSGGGNWSAAIGNDVNLQATVVRATSQTGPNYGMWVASTFGGNASASVMLVKWSTLSGGAAGTFFIEIMSNSSHSNAYALEVQLLYQPLRIPPRTIFNTWILRRRGSWVHTIAKPEYADSDDDGLLTGSQIGIALNGRTVEAWFYGSSGWALIDTADDVTLSGGAAVLPAGYALIGANQADAHVTDLWMDQFHAAAGAAGRFWVSLV